VNADPHGLSALQRALESKFNDLDALEFAKHARGFGDWLYSVANTLNAEEKIRARAEYDFLEGRLSFWIGYRYRSTALPNMRGLLILPRTASFFRPRIWRRGLRR
jgi:hypothetical protein